MVKVLVISEHHQGVLHPSVASAIQAAQQLAPVCDVLYASVDDTLSESIAEWTGVETVLTVLHPSFAHLLAENVVPLIANLAPNYTHILAPATSWGKNLMPRVAGILNVGQISDITAIESDNTFVRPIYAGNAYQTVRSHDPIKIITVRPTAFEPAAVGHHASARVLSETITPFDKIKFLEAKTPVLTRPELTAAKIVISGGRGLKSADNFKLLENLADKLGAAIGATRAAVDAGLVPNDWQVGQTGKVVAPNLYIAIGISGAIQHLAGMKDSKIIVAINKDPDAPIFQVADYGLVGDLFEILPKIIDSLPT